MDFIYNELSAASPAATWEEGRQRMNRFINAFAQTQQAFSARMSLYTSQHSRSFLRFEEHIEQIVLAKDNDKHEYTIQSWLQDRLTSHSLKNTFFAFKKYPFIPPDQEDMEERFMEPRFNMRQDMACGSDCHGLGVAYIQDFPSISFASGPEWENNLITFWRKRGQEDATQVFVVNIHSPACKNVHEVDQCLWSHVPVQPVETDRPANSKVIHISDDHGQDILRKFAQRLCRSPYIVKIRGSLPFHSDCASFIFDIRENGEIEIVLHWTDKGIGLLVQTTGRNLYETKEIAMRLAAEYDKRA